MRVLQICADRGIDPTATKGAAVHLRDLAAALTARGHDVVCAAARVDGRGPERPPVPIVPLDAGAALPAADVVHERYSLGHVGGLEHARRRSIPFVLEVNAPLVAEAAAHRPGTVAPDDAATEQRLLRDADLVLAVSEPLREWVASIRGTDDGTAVLRNGVDPARFAHPAPIDPGQGPPVLAFLGHPKPWHGADRLVPVLRAVRRHGIDARLRVIGGGPGGEAVAAAARRCGLADAVEVTGALPASAAAGHLAAAWVGLAPYDRVEHFYFCPLKVLEYQAAGLPVVTSRQGDLPALVGPAGILVTPGDVDALAHAVAGLVADPGVARRRGGAGRRRVLAAHTWSSVARRWEELVDGLRVAPGAERSAVPA